MTRKEMKKIADEGFLQDVVKYLKEQAQKGNYDAIINRSDALAKKLEKLGYNVDFSDYEKSGRMRVIWD